VASIKLSKKFIIEACKNALKEDIYPNGDITSKLLPIKKSIKAKIITNSKCVVGGLDFAKETFGLIDRSLSFKIKKKEGSIVKKKSLIAIVEGNIANILKGERVALNFLSHISGIATKTNNFVKKVNKKSKICCTRKTIPGLRIIQKYSVRLGGGTNHRFNLSDEYLIKDNHIANSDLRALVKKAIKNKKDRKITVEVDNLKQLKSILGLKFDRVLFDNMNTKNLKLGVQLAKAFYETEASGNITLNKVKSISLTGVKRISVGCITHSADAVDFKLEI
tara:strand:+ start:366 stop:1199 length:834 start_codon:yes stop_codon:yes gene_type:complete